MENTTPGADAQKNYFIKLYPSGHSIDLRTGPTVEQIEIEDIAHALGQINRFNGHYPHPYSDAEHSYYVSLFCEMGMYKPYFLLHDSPEYIYHDLTKPFKNLLEDYTDVYDKLTTQCMKTILKKFGLSYDLFKQLYPIIKKADNAVYEMERLHGRGGVPPVGNPLHGMPFSMPWNEAATIFQNTLETLLS